MKFNIANVVCCLVIFFSAYAFADPPKDMRPWRVGIVTPSYYPVIIEEAYGVNEANNWTSFIFGFDTYWRSKREIRQTYDGYAIGLMGGVASISDQKGPTTTLPDSLYIYWASLVERKEYAIKFDLTDKIKTEMMSPGRHRGKTVGGRHCYKNEIVFGLLPGGDAKAWISGCSTYVYIGKVSAIKESNTYLNNQLYLDLVTQDVKQSSIDNNIQLFPIPVDKIDKVIVKSRYEVLK